MNHLHLGLTDHERRMLDQKRRIRNCLIAITACILVIGFVAVN